MIVVLSWAMAFYDADSICDRIVWFVLNYSSRVANVTRSVHIAFNSNVSWLAGEVLLNLAVMCIRRGGGLSW